MQMLAEPVMLPPAPLLPMYHIQQQPLLDSPSKLTGSTRSSVTAYTPVRTGMNSLLSSARSYQEAEFEAVGSRAQAQKATPNKSPRGNSRRRTGSPGGGSAQSTPRSPLTKTFSPNKSAAAPATAVQRSASCASVGSSVKPPGGGAFDKTRRSVAERKQARSQPTQSLPPTRQIVTTLPSHLVAGNVIQVQMPQATGGVIQAPVPGIIDRSVANVGGAGMLSMCYSGGDSRYKSDLPMDEDEYTTALNHCSAVRDAVKAMSQSFREMESHTSHLHANGVHVPRDAASFEVQDPMEEESVEMNAGGLGVAAPKKTARKTRGAGSRSPEKKSGCTNAWCCAQEKSKGRRSKKSNKDTDSMSL